MCFHHCTINICGWGSRARRLPIDPDGQARSLHVTLCVCVWMNKWDANCKALWIKVLHTVNAAMSRFCIMTVPHVCGPGLYKGLVYIPKTCVFLCHFLLWPGTWYMCVVCLNLIDSVRTIWAEVSFIWPTVCHTMWKSKVFYTRFWQYFLSRKTFI